MCIVGQAGSSITQPNLIFKVNSIDKNTVAAFNVSKSLQIQLGNATWLFVHDIPRENVCLDTRSEAE